MKLQPATLGLSLFVALLLPLVPAAPQADADEDSNFLLATLEGLTIGEGQAAQDIIVFPLLVPEKREGLKVKPAVWSSKVAWSEPTFPWDWHQPPWRSSPC